MQSSAAISPGRAGSRYPLPLSATTPLSLKEGQYTDIFLKLHLVLSASPCLKLSGDPEVIGDIHSLCFSKTGKEKRQKGTPLREKTTVFFQKSVGQAPLSYSLEQEERPCFTPLSSSAKKGKETFWSPHP